LRQAAFEHDPTSKGKGMLTAGVESTRNSLRRLVPKARLGSCWLHAVRKLPGKRKAIASEVRQGRSHQFATLLFGSRERKSLRVFAWGQKLRHCAHTVSRKAGEVNGERVRQWVQDKKAGWYAVLEDPQMPTSSADLDQAHNAIDRKLFIMKGFHHQDGNQHAFINGLALLYNLMPYQRRAKHAGRCGVEVEGGKLPTDDWFLNLQVLTCGGFRWTLPDSTTKFEGVCSFRLRFSRSYHEFFWHNHTKITQISIFPQFGRNHTVYLMAL
jgi:hypothetical protein